MPTNRRKRVVALHEQAVSAHPPAQAETACSWSALWAILRMGCLGYVGATPALRAICAAAAAEVDALWAAAAVLQPFLRLSICRAWPPRGRARPQGALPSPHAVPSGGLRGVAMEDCWSLMPLVAEALAQLAHRHEIVQDEAGGDHVAALPCFGWEISLTPLGLPGVTRPAFEFRRWQGTRHVVAGPIRAWSEEDGPALVRRALAAWDAPWPQALAAAALCPAILEFRCLCDGPHDLQGVGRATSIPYQSVRCHERLLRVNFAQLTLLAEKRVEAGGKNPAA